MSSSISASKKRKSAAASSAATAAAVKKQSNNIRPLEHAANVDYSPLGLQEIYDRIAELCRKVPSVPESGFKLAESDAVTVNSTNGDNDPLVTSLSPLSAAYGSDERFDHAAIKAWATALQAILEEFNLLLACISPATYVWGTDRSGAADQNLSLLSNELVRSQEQIGARVSPRLNDVLAPVVTLITTKTVTVKQDDKEIKHNYYATIPEDEAYLSYCFGMLARNASLLRHVVLANFEKLLLALRDYADAQHTDSQHDSRGLLY